MTNSHGAGRLMLNGLRTFESVARLRSHVMAAAELHVSASAVSHQIRRLEEHLGLKLFTKTSKPLRLTAEGEIYFRDVSAAFAQLTVATERLLRSKRRAVVTISSFQAFAIKWLVPRLSAFHALHPEIEVRIGSSSELVDLHPGGVDIAIRWGVGRWPGVRCTKLLDENIQPVCSPSLLGRKRIRQPADIFQFPLIHMAFSGNHWANWSEALTLSVPPETRTLRFNEPLAAIQAAIDGLGMVQGSASLTYDDVHSGRLIAPLNFPMRLNEAVYLVEPIRTEAETNPHVDKFCAWLIETTARFAAELPPARAHVGSARMSLSRRVD